MAWLCSICWALARKYGRAVERLCLEAVGAIPSSAYPTPTKRPAEFAFEYRKLQNTFGLRLSHWQASYSSRFQLITPGFITWLIPKAESIIRRKGSFRPVVRGRVCTDHHGGQ